MIPRLPLWQSSLLVIASLAVASLHGPLSLGAWFAPPPLALGTSAIVAGATGAFLFAAARRRAAERAPAPIVTEHEPPDGLGPGEVAVLLRERLNPRDAIAIVVDLARRGHVSIEEVTSNARKPLADPATTWRISKRAADIARLRDHERTLLAGLFRERREVTLSDLAPRFFVAIDVAERRLQDDAHRRGWFFASPADVRDAWVSLGLGITLIGACLIAPLGAYFGAAILGLTILACGLALVAARHLMPHRTKAGTEALRRVLGFERYLAIAEAERQRFAEREKTTFPDHLAYAIVFGHADAWVDRLRSIDSAGAASFPHTMSAGELGPSG